MRAGRKVIPFGQSSAGLLTSDGNWDLIITNESIQINGIDSTKSWNDEAGSALLLRICVGDRYFRKFKKRGSAQVFAIFPIAHGFLKAIAASLPAFDCEVVSDRNIA